jgi:hypothetical protein
VSVDPRYWLKDKLIDNNDNYIDLQPGAMEASCRVTPEKMDQSQEAIGLPSRVHCEELSKSLDGTGVRANKPGIVPVHCSNIMAVEYYFVTRST